MKRTVLFLTLSLLGIGGSHAYAEPQVQKPSTPVVNQPWMASDKDIVGHWSWGAGTDEGWNADFHADHTITVFYEGLFRMGPIVSTWILKNNHILVDEAPFIKYCGTTLPRENYPATASQKYPLEPNFGSDLQVTRYQGYVVLYSTAKEADVQKYGPAPWFCLWQYEHTKKGYALPPAGAKLNKQVLEMPRQKQEKSY